MENVRCRMCVVAFAAAVAMLGAACGERPATPENSSSGAAETYAPGLGELMTLQQMRHTKLWLAGQAGNWDLAAYELEELGEGFDDIVKFHPTHKDAPVAPKDAIPRMIAKPIADLEDAVSRKDGAVFPERFDALTAACNSCHEATNFGFNRVTRPDSNPYPNQLFAPAQK